MQLFPHTASLGLRPNLNCHTATLQYDTYPPWINHPHAPTLEQRSAHPAVEKSARSEAGACPPSSRNMLVYIWGPSNNPEGVVPPKDNSVSRSRRGKVNHIGRRPKTRHSRQGSMPTWKRASIVSNCFGRNGLSFGLSDMSCR